MPDLERILERFQRDKPPLWFGATSLLLFLCGTCLFAVSLGPDVYRSRFAPVFIPVLLLGFALTAFLHVLFLHSAARSQRVADRAFYSSDRELASVFNHALDGILILDDQAICLDANPAALAILRIDRRELLGHSIVLFFPDKEGFANAWDHFLATKNQRGQTQLVCRDSSKVFVDYAIANYVPARHVAILCDTTERRRAEFSLRKSEERFQQMANHIDEAFWRMDAKTKEVEYVTKGYETITGRPISTIYENPTGYQELIHPEDRARVLAKLEDCVTTGNLDEELRITRPDGTIRWVWVKASAFLDAEGVARWLVGSAQDVTARKHAEMQVARHLATAQASSAEAEAMRKSTLALTQNLSMNAVLDALLASLKDLLDYDSACVMLAENDLRLFVARQAPLPAPESAVMTVGPGESTFLQKVLVEHKSILLPDTSEESGWVGCKPMAGSRCWLAVPLLASGRILGILSAGTAVPRALTHEHLRLAQSLAIPAAVAIENARLFERAEIYAAELQQRIDESKEMPKPLEQSQNRSRGIARN